MLNEVALARPCGPCGTYQRPHGVKLVVAREDERLALTPRPPLPLRGEGGLHIRSRCFIFDVGEVRQNVEQAGPLEHALPKIGGAVAVGVGRVARPAVIAQVEGQEARVLARQPRRHPHLGGANGEVN
jgi:hypothetical protein